MQTRETKSQGEILLDAAGIEVIYQILCRLLKLDETLQTTDWIVGSTIGFYVVLNLINLKNVAINKIVAMRKRSEKND